MNLSKTLMVSTALSAVALIASGAAMAAEKPKLTIGGYVETYFGAGDGIGTNSGTPTYASSDTTKFRATLLQYGEISFKAEGKTDSGMVVGAYIETAQDDAGTKHGADEINVYMQGSWGRLEVGGQDGAADKLQVGGTEVDMIGGNILGAYVYTNASASRSGVHLTDQTNNVDSSDNSKITYYTPRVSGVQAGLSWLPRANSRGTLGLKEAPAYDGAYEAGVSYKGKAGDAKFEIATTYGHMPSPDNNNDMKGWNIGAVVEVANFTVAAGYAKNDNWRCETANTKCDGKSYNLGIGYNMGKASIAATMLNVEGKTNGVAGKDKGDSKTLQAGYNFGGGLTGAVGYIFADMKENGTKTEDADGIIATMKVKF